MEQSIGRKGIDYPDWGDTDVYKKTIGGGYLYNGETPKEAYRRVARTVAKRLQKTEMEESFFEYIWKGWLCLASHLYYQTPELIAVYLLVALALTLLILS